MILKILYLPSAVNVIILRTIRTMSLKGLAVVFLLWFLYTKDSFDFKIKFMYFAVTTRTSTRIILQNREQMTFNANNYQNL
jgi:hypothetical protein